MSSILYYHRADNYLRQLMPRFAPDITSESVNPPAHIFIMPCSCIPRYTLSLALFIPSPQDPINLSFSIFPPSNPPALSLSPPSGTLLSSPRVFVREVGRKTFIVSGPCKPRTRERRCRHTRTLNGVVGCARMCVPAAKRTSTRGGF